MIVLLRGADSETDRRQSRMIDRAGLGHLQEQGLIRLLERWPLEHYHAVGPFAGSQPPLAQPVVHHWQLLGARPPGLLNQLALLGLSSQLNLRRHEQDVAGLRIHNREQDDHVLPAIDYFADPGANSISAAALTLRMLTVKSRQRRALLLLEKLVQPATMRHRQGRGTQRHRC